MKTTFIAGSRDMSFRRILSLTQKYAPKSQLIWGIYKEKYITGFEEQPQFTTLKLEKINKFIELLSKKTRQLASRIKTIVYTQKDESKIIKKLVPDKCIFINGSWKIAFHRREIFKTLLDARIKFSHKSPFEDEQEAIEYYKNVSVEIEKYIIEEIKVISDGSAHSLRSVQAGSPTADQPLDTYTSCNMTDSLQACHPERSEGSQHLSNDLTDLNYLKIADIISKRSFDYTWQTGAILVQGGKIILSGHNKILPYETYSMHHGSAKEHGLGKFSGAQVNDMNVNDTLHAEMDIISQALNQKLDISGSTLYIDLMPCPNCSRMLATTGIKKIVYRKTHSGGIGEKILKSVGIELEQCLES